MTAMRKQIALALCLATPAAPVAAKPRAETPTLTSTQFNCDAISTSQRLDAATMRELQPAHSLAAAAAILTRHGIKFERMRGLFSLDGIAARELREINTLPQGEPMVLPSREGSTICVLLPSAGSI